MKVQFLLILIYNKAKNFRKLQVKIRKNVFLSARVVMKLQQCRQNLSPYPGLLNNQVENYSLVISFLVTYKAIRKLCFI